MIFFSSQNTWDILGYCNIDGFFFFLIVAEWKPEKNHIRCNLASISPPRIRPPKDLKEEDVAKVEELIMKTLEAGHSFIMVASW